MNALRVLIGLLLLVLLFAAKPITSVPARGYTSTHEGAAAPEPLEGRDFVYYRVQPGDTLRSLERKFRAADSHRILELNPGLEKEDRLPSGRRLKIPIN